MKKLFLLISIGLVAGLYACGGGKTDNAGKEKDSVEKTEKDASTGATSREGEVRQLTLADFKSYVMDTATMEYLGDRPCVIDFYADWCGPCKEMSPVVERAAAKLTGKVDFMKVDVDAEGELAAMFGISSIPTFVFFAADGTPNIYTGMVPESEFMEMVERYCLGKQQ